MIELIIVVFFGMWGLLFLGVPAVSLVRMFMRAAPSSKCIDGRHASAGLFGCRGHSYGRTCSCGCHAPILD